MHIWNTKCSIDEFEKESEKGTFNIFYLELIRNPGSTVEFVRFSLAAFFYVFWNRITHSKYKMKIVGKFPAILSWKLSVKIIVVWILLLFILTSFWQTEWNIMKCMKSACLLAHLAIPCSMNFLQVLTFAIFNGFFHDPSKKKTRK